MVQTLRSLDSDYMIVHDRSSGLVDVRLAWVSKNLGDFQSQTESHLFNGSNSVVVIDQSRKIYSRGFELDTDPESFGYLDASHSKNETAEQLLSTLDRQGYLFLRDMFPREDILKARAQICQQMSNQGMLDPGAEVIDCVPAPSIEGNDKTKGSSTLDSIPSQCPAMMELLYGPSTQDFFQRLMGGPVRHYDLTWFRGVAPGLGTVPHCDIVFMGRGTHELLTMWVPYGDISLEMGGLMILENSLSFDVQKKIKKYVERDVDEYCENRPLPDHIDLESKTDNKVWNGWLATNPVTLRNNLGGRWLTAEFRPGDALIFSSKLVHGSLDNQTTSFRLSTDCRYQLASEPVDPRFVGERPFGHVGTAKRGRVC